MSRVIIAVLDSFGLGASADAERFGDVGANTFASIARICREQRPEGRLQLPNLGQLGLWHALQGSSAALPEGYQLPERIDGAWGWAREMSTGKDTPSGHWEIAGVPVLFDWGYFTDREASFPEELLGALIQQGELPGVLGNCHASGTEIIRELGEEHCASGKPIVYTSADSVFQIAAHEAHFGLARLLALCELCRELVDPYNIGRVIARPFIGEDSASFQRTGNRRDYAVPPPAKTVLDRLAQAGGQVWSVGKIADIFAGQGITHRLKANGNDALFDKTLEAVSDAEDRAIVFTNFVDFDTLYGHRRDPLGYALALEAFDKRLPQLRAALAEDDWLIITADHGCDPTWPGTDHTREHIPVLVSGPKVKAQALGQRESFADIGQSIAVHLGLPPMAYGSSFTSEIQII